MDKIIQLLIKECKDDADKLRRFDKRTRVVKTLIKEGIELLDRKQDGCLYLRTPYGCLKIYFQEEGDKVKLHTILCCTNSGIPINRENLTKS